LRYVERVAEELGEARAWAEGMGLELPRVVDTVYLGGGTPSLLAPELVGRIFEALRAEFEVEAGAEITVECAPGQIGEATLEALAGEGVNRVSLGVQSFVDREAAVSGRLHGRTVVLEDLRRLRATGIGNISVDLIAGLAGQTVRSWAESLEALADTGVGHASVYMLEVDEDSRLGRELLTHGLRYYAEQVPGDDAIAEMYERAVETLAAAGLKQYEISNFCRAGMESRHNLRYWQRRPYLGVGLDASSMLRARDGRVMRWTTTEDLKAYVAGAEIAESGWLTAAAQHEEAWFLGLRMNAGVDLRALEGEIGRELVARAMERVGELTKAGLVAAADERVWLTEKGRLLSNEVFAEFLGIAEGLECGGSEYLGHTRGTS
jgi:oxygen-independent coproporphyrinogen-3 oxidase